MEMTANLWSPSAGGGGDWRSAALARAPQILTFVLALAVAAQLALIVVGLTGRTRQAPPPTAAPPPATPLDVGALINAHLFGDAAAKANADAANAPPSTMPLVLTGVFATQDPKQGMAIIGESAPMAKFVIVGQQVPGGAQLHSVYNDRAIIDRGGVLESVFLPKTNSGPLAMAPPPPPRPPAGNEAAVERMRQMVASDPGMISQFMRPQAVFAGGKMRGFRVYPSGNRQAFARMGLRPGDLVTAINGTPLDDKDRAQEIFNTLSSSTEARVSLTRNGRQQELVLNLAQVAAEAEQASGDANADGNIPANQSPADQGDVEQNPGNQQ